MNNDPYSALGVPRDADGDTIKRAFRKKAKASHPDLHGGSKEAFLPVQRAYDILSDADRRARYDQFGEDGELDIDKEAAKTLVAIIKQVVEVSDVKRTDMMEMTRRYIVKQAEAGTAEIKKLKLKIAHWQEASKRTKAKKNNFVLLAFDAEISNLKNTIKGVEWDLELSRAMLKHLKHYEYIVDKIEQRDVASSSSLYSSFHL